MEEFDVFKQWYLEIKKTNIDLTNENSKVMVCKDFDKFIGFVFFYIIENEVDIIDVFVKEENRRTGVGKCLLETLFTTLRKQQVKKVFLEVNEKNKTAYNLYIHLGFEIVDIRKLYYEKKHNAYVMQKTL